MKCNMIDADIRKDLFNDYAYCHYFKVDNNGYVLKDEKLDIESISIDKNGDVSVKWRFNIYDDPEIASVNKVSKASYDDYIEGVFTSEENAVMTARQHFARQKLERIAKLEEEIKRLKEELNSQVECNSSI